MDTSKPPTTVDEYFAGLPEEHLVYMEKLRQTIRKATPKAEEVISYGMPAFRYHDGMLVYYAAAKNHCGFYPMPKAIVEFKEQLKGYKTSKGAIQFPWDKPVPVKLVTEIVKFRMKENEEKEMLKEVKKKTAKKK